MSAYDDLLAAVKDVRDRTGDPNAWQTGLAPAEVSAVITPSTRPEQLQAILAKIRRQHAEVFGAAPTGVARPPADAGPAPDRESGAAADAIASAEAALAQQNSVSSQLDMQVVTAILNAHLKAVDGREALTKLQQETEAAVRTRSDLDTPAGARDFQRFLIGKLRDIRAVVLNASLDDTSKSALMAAWTSLYDAAKSDRPGDHASSAGAAADAAAAGTSDQPDEDLDDEWDPLLDSLLADDDGSPIDPRPPWIHWAATPFHRHHRLRWRPRCRVSAVARFRGSARHRHPCRAGRRPAGFRFRGCRPATPAIRRCRTWETKTYRKTKASNTIRLPTVRQNRPTTRTRQPTSRRPGRHR